MRFQPYKVSMVLQQQQQDGEVKWFNQGQAEDNDKFKENVYSNPERRSDVSPLQKGTSGLNNKIPAEKCGILIEGSNKWKTLIENASNEKKI